MPEILSDYVTVEKILTAAKNIKGIAMHTPLVFNPLLSERFDANIYLKREDLQVVRSYKIRGAYNKIQSLSREDMERGVVCASAGNHAQGVAFSCYKKNIPCTIYMPLTTSDQKVNQVKMFGKHFVDVVLVGDTFDDALAEALQCADTQNKIFIPPFDDQKIIEGQGTVGKEILDDATVPIDYLVLPVGGGGLAAGVSSYFKACSPTTEIIGVEPMGAPAMKQSIEQGEIITLKKIDSFVDGAAVRRVGEIPFRICKETLSRVIEVHEGRLCSEILKLYNEQAVVVEPAGVLSIAALNILRDEIKEKNVVCIVSGSNSDMMRATEIKERALLFEGLKHYFIINFPQRSGALREFLTEVLGPNDDIAHFEYSKKNSREKGPALIGIELKHAKDLNPLMDRIKKKKFRFKYINDQPELFHFLI